MRRKRLMAVVGLALVFAALTAPQVFAIGGVEFLARGHLVLRGSSEQEDLAQTLAAQDVNGDGRVDTIIGAPRADNNGRADSGSVYFVFGGSADPGGAVDSPDLGARGFRIDGAFAGEGAGISVAALGDLNGDGLGDTLIASAAAHTYDGAIGMETGIFVVFGKRSTTPVDLLHLGSGGYAIQGTGYASASAAGDVNGDGVPDILIGGCPSRRFGGGSIDWVCVVFGKASSTPVDLAQLGSGGYRIGADVVASGADLLDIARMVVSAGDVNGDGRADVLLGARGAANNGRRYSGSAYVIYGKSSTTSVDLTNLGSGGYRIDGAAPGDGAGNSVASAGDQNGDGYSDALIGSPGVDSKGLDDPGAVYVVFGKTSSAPVDLAALGSGGYRIDGAAESDVVGVTVANAGDQNGDGRDDFLVTDRHKDDSRLQYGSLSVIYGRSSRGLDLSTLVPSDGYTITGDGDIEGLGAITIGDADHDGRGDLLVGTPNSGHHTGAAYLFLSGDEHPASGTGPPGSNPSARLAAWERTLKNTTRSVRDAKQHLARCGSPLGNPRRFARCARIPLLAVNTAYRRARAIDEDLQRAAGARDCGRALTREAGVYTRKILGNEAILGAAVANRRARLQRALRAQAKLDAQLASARRSVRAGCG